MIDLKADCGGSGGSSNSSLPAAPAKAGRNTTDAAAIMPTGVTSGSNGRYRYSYQFWDVSTVTGLANHTFAIGSGDSSWDSSLVMALRNDATGATVWTKAYSTLGSTGPHGVVMDITAGNVWVFVGNQGTGTLRLWRVKLSDGTATKVADAAVNNYQSGNTVPMMIFARFAAAANTIEFVFWGASANTIYSCSVNTSTGVFSSPVQITPWGATLGGESYSRQSESGTDGDATIQYITKDKKAAITFTPSDLINSPALGTATNGGNRGSIRTVIVYRGFSRAVLSIANDMYHIPYRADLMTTGSTVVEQLFVTDNAGAVANLKAKTQYVPAWDGRFDFYSADDLDRWIHEIADDAGLPAGTAMW